MSLAITVGFFTAYPTNWWLVSKGLKHGLMTVRPTRLKSSSVGTKTSHPALLETS